jgi:hypothetical protein
MRKGDRAQPSLEAKDRCPKLKWSNSEILDRLNEDLTLKPFHSNHVLS